MKRSEINAAVRGAETFMAQMQVHLPPFARWTPQDWAELQREPKSQGAVRELAARQLGWDVTDFGSGDYARTGLCLFALRNGVPGIPGQTYAEKLLVVGAEQHTPMHFHWHKTEDIINRGGGVLAIRLQKSTEDSGLGTLNPVVFSDGRTITVHHGGILRLHPGESVTLPPLLYHEFWAEDAPVLVGEVSTINDDAGDNRFLSPIGRFPTIDEDEAPHRLLVSDLKVLAAPQGTQ